MSGKQVKEQKRVKRREQTRIVNQTLDELLKQKFTLRLRIAWRVIKGE